MYIFQFILGIHTVRAVYYLYITDWGGLAFSEFMVLQSYFMIIIFILEIPSGAIADFVGRKRALSLSALVVSVAAFTYSIIPNILLFYLSETLWAFSIALISGTDEAFLFTNLKNMDEEEKLPKVMGRIQLLNLIALTISAPLGSVIAEFVSLPFTMNVLGVVYFAAFVVSLTFKEPHVKNEMETQPYITILKEGFSELRRNKILRILCFDRLFINILIFLLFWTYQPYLDLMGIPGLYWGIILAGMNIINAVFAEIVPRILQKFENKLIFLILVDVINGCAFILMSLTINPIFGIIFLFLIVGFGYPRFLIYVHGINKQIKSENRATVLSTLNMFNSLLFAVLYLLIGFIVEVWGLLLFFFVNGILILFFTLLTRIKNEYL